MEIKWFLTGRQKTVCILSFVRLRQNTLHLRWLNHFSFFLPTRQSWTQFVPGNILDMFVLWSHSSARSNKARHGCGGTSIVCGTLSNTNQSIVYFTLSHTHRKYHYLKTIAIWQIFQIIDKYFIFLGLCSHFVACLYGKVFVQKKR